MLRTILALALGVAIWSHEGQAATLQPVEEAYVEFEFVENPGSTPIDSSTKRVDIEGIDPATGRPRLYSETFKWTDLSFYWSDITMTFDKLGDQVSTGIVRFKPAPADCKPPNSPGKPKGHYVVGATVTCDFASYISAGQGLKVTAYNMNFHWAPSTTPIPDVIPLPGSLPLMLGGLMLAGAMARRRQR